MGANGAGSVDLGGNGTGFNPATMMAGMALGGAVGQNIAGTMNNVMSNVNPQSIVGSVPPPIPQSTFHVVVNGQAVGPFDVSAMTQMISSGTLTKDSLIWQQGMADWVKANDVNEIKNLFTGSVPPVPKE